MAKTQTVENDFVKVPDFTQFQAEFSKWAGDFGKYFVNGKAPSFDFDAVFALQRKNVEAFTAANQLAFDGVTRRFAGVLTQAHAFARVPADPPFAQPLAQRRGIHAAHARAGR